jgi:hypothetical protein
MSYRDELDAALARIAALEKELEEARRTSEPAHTTALEKKLTAERARADKARRKKSSSPDEPPDLYNLAVGLGFADFAALMIGGILWREEAIPGYTLDTGYRALGAIVVLVAGVAFVMARRSPRFAPNALRWALSVVPVASIVLFLAAHLLNRVADGAPSHEESANVTEVETTPRHTEAHVTFRRVEREPQSIALYPVPSVGQSLRMIIHPGRFGWEWAEVPPQRR